eukprot:gene11572-15464_t
MVETWMNLDLFPGGSMRRIFGTVAVVIALYPLQALAAVPKPPVEVSAPVSASPPAAAPTTPTLVRKVAVGRFTNSTRYGKALLLEGEKDPLAGQAADMLTARLVDSGQFMVFERSDLSVLSREQVAAGGSGAGLTGVD